MPYKYLCTALGAVLVISFAVLGGVGLNIQSGAPPIPQQVVTGDGHPLFDHDAIQRGQAVWQSLGGQQVGSIWGHGAYIAPDWTADWLHRETVFILDRWARDAGA
jgi:nitric oxide reductase subunit B